MRIESDNLVWSILYRYSNLVHHACFRRDSQMPKLGETASKSDNRKRRNTCLKYCTALYFTWKPFTSTPKYTRLLLTLPSEFGVVWCCWEGCECLLCITYYVLLIMYYLFWESNCCPTENKSLTPTSSVIAFAVSARKIRILPSL